MNLQIPQAARGVVRKLAGSTASATTTLLVLSLAITFVVVGVARSARINQFRLEWQVLGAYFYMSVEIDSSSSLPE